MLNQETAKAARTDSGYILRAPRRMRVADAVAQYMRVPMGAGNSVPWDPLVAPYVIEPMNCLASREYDAVIFVGPARTGKTIGLIDGWVIYNVICDPADMLIIQMTEEKAREHSKKRLARTFRVSPEVVSRLSPNKNDNNVYDRTFLAGNYLKIGWPSVNIMSSSDYKCVALTDYDRFPEDIDGEGDAFSLASKRTHSISGTANSAGAHQHKSSGAFGGTNTSIFPNGYTAISNLSAGIMSTTSGSGQTRNAGKTSSDGAHTHSLSGTAASAGAHAHTVSIGAHTHSVAIGSHGHTITVNAAGNAENTVKNIAFNYIVRLA